MTSSIFYLITFLLVIIVEVLTGNVAFIVAFFMFSALYFVLDDIREELRKLNKK